VTKRSRGWLALALLFVALRALPNISYPMHRDQATYCVVAQDLLHGAKLYRDVWDNKPPGIFWIYELIVKLFGPVMWSVGVVDVLWLLVISWCVFRFAAHYLGLGSAVGAVLVNAHLHCRAAGYVNAAQTESFLILFIFLAYFLVWRQGRWTLARHFAAGLVFGGAFWLKYNAVAFLPLLLLLPYLDLNGLDSAPLRPRLRVPWRAWLERSITLVAGWSTVSVAVLAYFWQAGLWSVLWESHFAVLPGYGASPVGRESYLTLAVLRTTYHLGLFPLSLRGSPCGWPGGRANWRALRRSLLEQALPTPPLRWAFTSTRRRLKLAIRSTPWSGDTWPSKCARPAGRLIVALPPEANA